MYVAVHIAVADGRRAAAKFSTDTQTHDDG